MQIKISPNGWLYGIALLTILIGFHLSYGLEVIIPTNIHWLMSVYHDWGQHYLGWAYFRNEPWQFPLGAMENINYPAGTNVGYMDSIPLLALFFKLFNSVLPATFQYLGAYILVSHLLAGVYTIRILKLFNTNRLIMILAAVWLGLNPLLFYRGIHPATTAHWLLLASLFYYLKPTDLASAIRTNLKQLLLVVIAALINPYLFLFIIGFNLILPIKHVVYDKVLAWWKGAGVFIASIFSVLLSWYMLGMITLGNEVTMAVSNSYGLYSMNLNSFFNSGGFSNFFLALNSYNPFQYEGYAYLGLGGIVLTMIGLSFLTYSLAKRKFKLRKGLLPLILLTAGLSIFAITHQITLGDRLLFEVPIPEALNKLGSIFRASGRFIWLAYYVVVLSAIIWFGRIPLNQYIKASLLVGLMAIQFYDIQLFFLNKDFQYGAYSPDKLEDNRWGVLVEDFDHIVTYPPHKNDLLYTSDYQDLCFLALQSSKPISIGYVARETTYLNKQYVDSLRRDMEQETLSEQDLYITTTNDLEDFFPLIYNQYLQLGYLDGYYFLHASERSINGWETTDAEQVKVDSVHRAIALNGKWDKTEAPQQGPDSIVYNLENFAFFNNVLRLRGWALTANETNSSGDTIYITLSGEKASFSMPLTTMERKDVTGHFGAENLDNAGFSSVLYTHHLPKGNYAIGMTIKKADGKVVSQPLDQLEPIALTPELRPLELETMPPLSDKIRCNVESIEQLKKEVIISGWAMYMDLDATNSTIQLVWTNEQGTFVTATEPVLRSDVTSYFNTGFNYDQAGFKIRLKKKYIVPGKYTLGVLVTHPDRGEGALISPQEILLEAE